MNVYINNLSIPAVFWVTATSLVILASQNWRRCIAALALQYIGVFILSALNWPIEMAVTILVAGWIASAVLSLAIGESTFPDEGVWSGRKVTRPSNPVFRVLVGGLVILTVQSLVTKAVVWIPEIHIAETWGGIMLFGMGLMQLGFSAQPSRVAISLLTILSGFVILYAAVESSALLAGLLAATNLGISLIGAYLVLAPNMEESK